MYVHSRELRFEWDPAKRLSNLRKHGIDFADAIQVFDAPLLVSLDGRAEHGEDRWLAIGQLNTQVVVVAFAERLEISTIRLISARRALKHERKIYEEIVAKSTQPPKPRPGRKH